MGHGSVTNLDGSKPPNLVMARHGVWLGAAFGPETERGDGSIVGRAALRSASRGCRVQSQSPWDRAQHVPRGELENAKRELRPLLNALRFIESSNRLNCPDGDAGSSIGPLQISEEYHRDAWGHRAGRWTACRELAHAEDTVVRYWLRYCPGAIRARDWELLAKFHNGGPRGTKHSKTRAYWRKIMRHLSAQQSLGLAADVTHIPPQLPGTFRPEVLTAECSATTAASGATANSALTVSAILEHHKQQRVKETGCAYKEARGEVKEHKAVEESEPGSGAGRFNSEQGGEGLKRGHRRPQQTLRPVAWRNPAAAAAAAGASPSLAAAAHASALAALSALPPLGAADETHALWQFALPLSSPPTAAAAATRLPSSSTPGAEARTSPAPTAQSDCPSVRSTQVKQSQQAIISSLPVAKGLGESEEATKGSLAEAKSGSGWLLWDSDLIWPVEHHEDFFTPAASLDVQEAVKQPRGASVDADVADKLAEWSVQCRNRGWGMAAGGAGVEEGRLPHPSPSHVPTAVERRLVVGRVAKAGTEGSGDSMSSLLLAGSTSADDGASSALAESGSAVADGRSGTLGSREGARGVNEAQKDASSRVEEWLRLVDGGRSRASGKSTDGVQGSRQAGPGGVLQGSSSMRRPCCHVASAHQVPLLQRSSSSSVLPRMVAGGSAADKVEAWVHGRRGTAAVTGAAVLPSVTC